MKSREPRVESLEPASASEALLPSTLGARPSTDLDASYALCSRPDGTKGFTLLEVMIAMFVFFIVVFAVLGMVVQSLGAARALQRPQADFSILASALTLSNVLEEGVESGDFADLGAEFQDYYWERQIIEVGSNGLFQVDFAIFMKNARGKDVREDMSILMYKPGGRRRR
ncbi:MAG TPA: prepilin-type N-terminal cleavage/methylation domain-containing protein [Methylomirabilota bacterium]|nr:prepilin-type N-terminal cleavage/methylation domain-containing protein [Methylomirabilota bacterium]